jgi:predicted homoserine dehydrogenase-like protein
MQNICEDGYQGNHDPFFQEISDDYEELQMNFDSLDNGSVVVNFDIFDTENDQVIKQGGYVMVRKDEDEHLFTITIVDASGDVVHEINFPFDFKEC